MQETETIVTGVGGRYASALFGLAKDRNETGRVAEDLRTFGAAVAGNPDLQRFVRSPVIAAGDQGRALASILPTLGIQGTAADFIRLVAAKRRLFALADMTRDYMVLNDAFNGVTRAAVTVAAPLGAAPLARLKDQLRTATGKTVEVDVKVDPAIIGGLVVKMGSRMVDGSIRTKLNAIRTRMKEVR